MSNQEDWKVFSEEEPEGTTMGEVIMWVLVLMLTVSVGGYLIWLSVQRDEQMTAYSNCIDEQMEKDGYTGSSENAWSDYEKVCTNQY